MQRILVIILALTLFSPAPLRSDTQGPKEYRSKDGNRVVIFPIRKWTSEPAYISHESRLEFYSPDNKLLCALDYSSEDHEHGFGVVKAAWTPDSKYFVFSLTSSGGHQAWHAPTIFYSVRDSEIHSLESYLRPGGISNANFKTRSPNIVLTEVRDFRADEASTPVKFRLDSLMENKSKSHHPLLCTDGKVLQPEH